MFYFLTFVQILLFLTLIIGLINPKIVLGWIKNPNRLKVFFSWLILSFVVGGLSMGAAIAEDTSEMSIKQAKEYIKVYDYDSAAEELQRIEEGDEYYIDAALLKKEVDSLNKLKTEKALIKARKEKADLVKVRLENLISSIDNKEIDFSNLDEITDLQMALYRFNNWAEAITDGVASDDPEIKKLADNLNRKAIKIQAREFPKIRKAFGRIMADKLWAEDIKVYVSGPGNRYINFSGGIFAANQNKLDFHNQLRETLVNYRFTQDRYRWYDGEDEFTFWEMGVKKDVEVSVIVSK